MEQLRVSRAGRRWNGRTPADHFLGLAWHHVLHARTAIARREPWQAEYWISAVRDHVLALACLRFGLSTAYAKGADALPAAITTPLGDALVASLELHELSRALSAAVVALLPEVDAADPALSARLRPVLVPLHREDVTLTDNERFEAL